MLITGGNLEDLRVRLCSLKINGNLSRLDRSRGRKPGEIESSASEMEAKSSCHDANGQQCLGRRETGALEVQTSVRGDCSKQATG